MKLILREMVEGLGNPGDLVEVKAGYGSNFLLPKGLALRASAANEGMIEADKARREEAEKVEAQDAEELAIKLSGVVVNVKRKVSEGDVLYGSVTAADIAEVLAEEGFEISKDQISLDHAIKALGGHEIALNLPYGVKAAIKLWVVKDEEE